VQEKLLTQQINNNKQISKNKSKSKNLISSIKKKKEIINNTEYASIIPEINPEKTL
jgi:hypothetical protein